MSELLADQRIVISGIGAITPVGSDLETSWDNLLKGASGIVPIESTDIKNLRAHDDIGAKVAAGVPEFDPFIDELLAEHKNTIKPEIKKNWHRSTLFAFLAMYRALDQAKLLNRNALTLDANIVDPFRAGAYIGSTFSGAAHLDEVADKSRDRIRPGDLFKFLPARVAVAPAMQLGLNGPTMLVGAECASGAMAIDKGAKSLLKYRADMPPEADIMVVGGADGPIAQANIRFFEAMGEAVDPTDRPKLASRPFDQEAHGLVMAEGAAAFVLETWEHAQKRGLTEEDILAELVGYGSLRDAANITRAGVEGAKRVLKQVMDMSYVTAEDRGYINAHATSTPIGDGIEAKLTVETLHEQRLDPKKYPTTSTKGATGHTMGAAGAIEAAFTAMAVRDDIVPPALKLENPIPETRGLNLGKPQAMEVSSIDIGISSSFGFGGTATALAFRKFKA